MSEWKTIDTAPQDGTPILGWSADFGARQTASRTYTPGSPGHAQGRTDRWWDWVEEYANTAHRWHPTHWQPLPSPPST